MDFETRDRVAREYFASEYSSEIWNHSSGSMKLTFGPQLDGWIYWCEKGLLSISKIKGTGKNWVQPYEFNSENPPRIRNFLIGCAVDFGLDLSVSMPKNKAKDLVEAYSQGIKDKSFKEIKSKGKKTSKKTAKSKRSVKKSIQNTTKKKKSVKSAKKRKK
jgi:hypothetical protein